MQNGVNVINIPDIFGCTFICVESDPRIHPHQLLLCVLCFSLCEMVRSKQIFSTGPYNDKFSFGFHFLSSGAADTTTPRLSSPLASRAFLEFFDVLLRFLKIRLM